MQQATGIHTYSAVDWNEKELSFVHRIILASWSIIYKFLKPEVLLSTVSPSNYYGKLSNYFKNSDPLGGFFTEE